LSLVLLVALVSVSTSRATAKNQKDRPILLQIYFKVSTEQAKEFEKMFASTYVPALKKQDGYLRSNLLRIFPAAVVKEIQAAETPFNYQMELVFDTEANRRKWVASKEHQKAWPLASSMAEKFAWRGFDVVRSDRNSD